MNNGNWTSCCALYECFQNWMGMQHKCDLKSQVWFQIKIAQSKVQLSLYYYIHFEIKKIQSLKYRMFRSVQIFYCSNAELVSTKLKSCPSFSSNLICNFNKALKSDWLLSFSKAVSLAEKKTWLKGKQWCDFLINLKNLLIVKQILLVSTLENA